MDFKEYASGAVLAANRVAQSASTGLRTRGREGERVRFTHCAQEPITTLL